MLISAIIAGGTAKSHFFSLCVFLTAIECQCSPEGNFTAIYLVIWNIRFGKITVNDI